jgi:hypothetical protein
MRTGLWVRLMLLLLCAAFSFGGTFVCKTSTHDDPDPRPVPQKNAT